MFPFSPENIQMWSAIGPSGVLGLFACKFAETDERFTVITADLGWFSGLDDFRDQAPDRLINVGIAEQNMIGLAAGMAKEGLNVFTTTYATFASTRCLDQVRVNMGYMKIPVRLVGLTSGFSIGILGGTHMSCEDLAIMRSIPNIIVLSPADCGETLKVLSAAAICPNPVYIRLSGTTNVPIVYQEDYNFEIGKAVTLTEGNDVAIIATGSMVAQSLKVSETLSNEGISCGVINMHTIKPLDTEAIRRACKTKLIVTVEEHSIVGGLGGEVAEELAQMTGHPPQLRVGIEDFYPRAARYEYLLEVSGLTAPKIAEKILRKYTELKPLPVPHVQK